MHAKLLMAGLVGLGLFASHTALAQSSNLTNSATVVASCSVATTQNLNFGSINGLDLDSFSGQAQGMINVKCTAGSYQIYLSNGGYPISGEGTSCLQRMKNPTDIGLLVYAINMDNSYTSVYPNNAAPCRSSVMNAQVYKTVVFASGVREVNVPVYASIQKNYMRTNRFGVGNHSDSITVYIAF